MSNPENYPMEVVRDIPTIKILYENEKLDFDYIEDLKDAVNFTLPEGGFLLNDKLKGLYNHNGLNLPYPKTSISYSVDGVKYVILAMQCEKNHPIIAVMFQTTEQKKFLLNRVLTAFSSDVELHETKISGVKFNDITLNESSINDRHEYYYSVSAIVSQTIMELLEALSCSNVSHEPIPRKKGLSGISAKNMALPMYENRRLVINANRKDSNRKDNGVIVIGGHASPREHLRRGHIRNLQDGRKIWVNSCVVGAAANGRIDKTYVIK